MILGWPQTQPSGRTYMGSPDARRGSTAAALAVVAAAARAAAARRRLSYYLIPPKKVRCTFSPPPFADQKVTIIGEPFRRKPGKHPRRHGARQSRDVRRGCGRGSGEAARAARSGGQRQGQLRRRILQKDPLIAVSAKPFALPLKGLLEVPKPQSVSSESAAPVSSRPATVDP